MVAGGLLEAGIVNLQNPIEPKTRTCDHVALGKVYLKVEGTDRAAAQLHRTLEVPLDDSFTSHIELKAWKRPLALN